MRQLARIGRNLAAHRPAAVVHGAAAVRRHHPRAVDERTTARAGRTDRQPRLERGGATLPRAAGSAVDRHRDRVHLASVEGNRSVGGPRRRARDGRNAGVLQRGELDARSTRAADGRPRDRERLDAASDALRCSTRRPGMPPPIPRRGRSTGGAARRSATTARYPAVEVSLTVNRGEVLGLAGLIGAGRSELAEAICGVGTRLSGRVLLDGHRWRPTRRATPSAPASAWCPRTDATTASLRR